MVWGRKLVLVLTISLPLYSQVSKAQTDTVQTIQTEPNQTTKPDLKTEPDTKRQRNRTERTVLVSCLLIVLTTILIYNARSK